MDERLSFSCTTDWPLEDLFHLKPSSLNMELFRRFKPYGVIFTTIQTFFIYLSIYTYTKMRQLTCFQVGYQSTVVFFFYYYLLLAIVLVKTQSMPDALGSNTEVYHLSSKITIQFWVLKQNNCRACIDFDYLTSKTCWTVSTCSSV